VASFVTHFTPGTIFVGSPMPEKLTASSALPTVSSFDFPE
jgi:hypothetical protein